MLLMLAQIVMLPVAAWWLLKAAVHAVEWLSVMIAVAPGARAAAIAERSLPARDLAFDFDGDRTQAELFDTIVRDRLRRTRQAAQRPELTLKAARIGRQLAGA